MFKKPTSNNLGDKEFNYSIHIDLLQNEISQVLRKEIVLGDFYPGERLSEEKLAEKFKVSRAPIREAFRELVKEGLLIHIPRKGTYVIELNETDIKEIYSLRQALELLAVEILVDKINPEQIEILKCLIEEMKVSLNAKDVLNTMQLDMRFHEELCRFSGHSRLLKTWLSISSQLRSFFASTERLYEDSQLVERHQTLVQSIASGDKQAAKETLRNHITDAANRLMSNLLLTNKS
jgi:DNA-binding GntR family transcriptional regulator